MIRHEARRHRVDTTALLETTPLEPATAARLALIHPPWRCPVCGMEFGKVVVSGGRTVLVTSIGELTSVHGVHVCRDGRRRAIHWTGKAV